MENTLIIIKPDGVRRNLIGKILSRYEEKGMRIAAIKSLKPEPSLVEEHYEEHRGKDFYPELINYLSSDMVVALVLEGENAVKCARILNGATKFSDAQPGTIRGDFACSDRYNLVHASDSTESARREIILWFPELSI